MARRRPLLLSLALLSLCSRALSSPLPRRSSGQAHTPHTHAPAGGLARRVLIVAEGRSGSSTLLSAFRAWKAAAFVFFEPFAGAEAHPLLAQPGLAPAPSYAALFACELTPEQWRRIMWPEACRAVLQQHGPLRHLLPSCLQGRLDHAEVAQLRAACRAASVVVIKTIRLPRSPLATLDFGDAAAGPLLDDRRLGWGPGEPRHGRGGGGGGGPAPLQIIRLTRRDPLAIVQSWLRLGWFGGDALRAAAALCDSLLFHSAFLASRPHAQLALEDYVADPMAVWERLAPACGLPWGPEEREALRLEIDALFEVHHKWLAYKAKQPAPAEAYSRKELWQLWRDRCPGAQSFVDARKDGRATGAVGDAEA